jgi:hypothetical protein
MEFRFLRDVVCAIQRKVLNAVHSYSETSGDFSQAATAPARTLHNVTPTVFLIDIYTVNCRWLKGRIKYVLGTRPIEETTMPTIAFVVFDGFYSMALTAQSVFEFTNVELGKPFYEMLNVSERGGPVRASSGLTVLTEAIDDRVFDTVIFPGSNPATATAEGAGVCASQCRDREAYCFHMHGCIRARGGWVARWPPRDHPLVLCARFAHPFSICLGGR